eukprot:3941930-Rhodomonas_salina.2
MPGRNTNYVSSRTSNVSQLIACQYRTAWVSRIGNATTCHHRQSSCVCQRLTLRALRTARMLRP